jgi:hypothetical protein
MIYCISRMKAGLDCMNAGWIADEIAPKHEYDKMNLASFL